MSDAIKGFGGLVSAEAQARDLQLQAKMEGVAAQDRELQRTRQLRQVLAANAASAAGRGVTATGSVSAIQGESVQRFQEDQEADAGMTKFRQESLRARAKLVKRGAQINAVASLWDTAETAGKLAAGGG